MKVSNWIQIAITAGALIIAVVHVVFPLLKIDAATIALIIISIVPWLGSLFKAIELPGGWKIEYQEVKEAEIAAEKAGLLTSSGADKTLDQRHVYAFEAVVDRDPKLALAGLRIEIESRLREISNSRGIQTHQSLRQILRELRNHEILNQQEIAAIDDILPLLNSAAHGANIDDRAAYLALEVGTGILKSLEERRGETSIPQILERWRHRDGAGVAEIGTELSKAFVKSPIAFLHAMKNDPESFSAWLKKMEHHTFTIFESTDEIEDDLYYAYYEKLKSLMEKAAKEAINSEYSVEAQRVFKTLSDIEIRRIW